MATRGNGLLTLTDYGKRAGHLTDSVIEVMKQKNEMLEDMVFLEANNGTVHKSILRTELPKGEWRMLNKGVGTSKSRTVEIHDNCSMLSVYSKVDAAMVDLQKNSHDKAEMLWDEEKAFIQGISQQHQEALIYGSGNPAAIVGLEPRYAEQSNRDWFKKYLLNAGGTGNKCTSIYLIGWGKLTVHGIFPQGSKAGIQVMDKGLLTVRDEDGKEFEAYVKYFELKTGLAIRDPRCVVRIANIDTANIGSAKLIDLMSEATETIQDENVQNMAFYMRRDVRTALRQQIRDKNNVHLTIDEIAGKKVMQFDGVPVRRVDALRNDEKALSL